MIQPHYTTGALDQTAANSSQLNAMSILYPVVINHEPKTGQTEPDPGIGEGYIGDHPGRIAIVTAAGLLADQGDIGLPFQRAGKETGC